MNRICPSEKTLSEYMAGALKEEEKVELEKHLASCSVCRRLLAEAHEVTSKFSARETMHSVLQRITKNKWLIASSIALILSFLVPRYFLQFLAASLLAGAKWITDSKTTKMLITIYEAWKSGDREKQDKILSRFHSKK